MNPTLATQVVSTLPISLVSPDPDQPRKSFDPEYIEGLAQSIKAEGLLQPITVRRNPEAPETFRIIAGECRWRAHGVAGIQTIRAIIVEDDGDAARRLRVQLMENVKRNDMTFREEAKAILRLREMGDSAENIRSALGMTAGRLETILRLCKMPETIWAMIDAGAINRKVAEQAAGHLRIEILERALISVAGKGKSAAHATIFALVDAEKQIEFSLACEVGGAVASVQNQLVTEMAALVLAASSAIQNLTPEQVGMLGRKLGHELFHTVNASNRNQRSAKFVANTLLTLEILMKK